MNSKTKFTMAIGALGKVIIVRLKKGDDLLKSLEEIVIQNNIKSGVILSGAASLSKTVLRNLGEFPKHFPITDEERVFQAKEEPMELLSLSGNISLKEGKPFIHGHITVSTAPEGVAYGGHLVEGSIIFSTGEIMLAELENARIFRKKDLKTQNYEFYPTNDYEEE